MFRGAGPSDGSRDYPMISIDLNRSGAASDDFGSLRGAFFPMPLRADATRPRCRAQATSERPAPWGPQPDDRSCSRGFLL